MTPAAVDEWIFQLDRPHATGTICGFPCEQCGDRPMAITVRYTKLDNPPPMFILGPATEAEYLDNVEARWGLEARNKVRILATPHYYRVSLD